MIRFQSSCGILFICFFSIFTFYSNRKSIIHLQMKKIRDDIEGEMSIADKTFFIISRKCCSLDIGEINQQKQYLLDFISENNMNQLMESK